MTSIIKAFYSVQRTLNVTIQYTDGQPYPLTGLTAWFMIKKDLDMDHTNTQAIISKSVTSHVDAANGRTQFVLTDADMSLFPGAGKYYWQIQVGTSAADTITTNVGEFMVYLPVRV